MTGHDESGKAVIVADEGLASFVPPEYGGKWLIWAADENASLPNDGSAPAVTTAQIPVPGGVKVIRLTLPPEYNPDTLFDPTAPPDPEMAAQLGFLADPNPPGSYGTLPGAAGMHATASVDCLMQLSGESVFLLEDAEVRLRPGDWLVINGVVHSWRNDGEEPSVIIGVVVGAEHDGIPKR